MLPLSPSHLHWLRHLDSRLHSAKPLNDHHTDCISALDSLLHYSEHQSSPITHFTPLMATPAASRPWRPVGYPSTVSSYLVSTNAHSILSFITQVFQAQVLCKVTDSGNTIVQHALVSVDGCAVMLAEATTEQPPTRSWLYVYVDDVDATYEAALKEGAETVQAPRDESYGDRVGAVKDAGGNTWWIATHKGVGKAE